MRIAALIFAIAGAVIALMFCIYWIGDAQDAQAYANAQGAIGQMAFDAVADKVAQRTMASWLLVGSAVAGIVGGILAFRRKGRVGAALLAAGAVAPAFVYGPSLVATAPLLLGALFAFLTKPRAAVLAVGEARA